MNTTGIIQFTTERFTGIQQEMAKDFAPIDILYLIIALGAAYVIGRLLAVFIKRNFAHKIRKGQLDILTGVIRFIIIILAIGLVLPSFLRLSLLILVIVLIGVIIIFALSSQDILSNFVAGMALYYEKPFHIGDVLTVDNVLGRVEKLSVFSTTVEANGSAVRIPNKDLLNKPFTNFWTYSARRAEYVFGIRYEDDCDLAIRVIRERLEQETYVLRYPAPDVFVSDLAESSVNIKCRFWFPSVIIAKQDDISIKLQILSRTRKSLQEHGIEIAYPQQVIWFGQDNDTGASLPADRNREKSGPHA